MTSLSLGAYLVPKLKLGIVESSPSGSEVCRDPSPVLGLKWALHLFVVIIPCIVLHWISAILLSTGGLYRTRQTSLEEESGSQSSFHFHSAIVEKELLCLEKVQMVYSCFPCAMLSFVGVGSLSQSRDPAVATGSWTAEPYWKAGEGVFQPAPSTANICLVLCKLSWRSG